LRGRIDANFRLAFVHLDPVPVNGVGNSYTLSRQCPFCREGRGKIRSTGRDQFQGHLPKIRSDRTEAGEPPGCTQGVEWKGLIEDPAPPVFFRLKLGLLRLNYGFYGSQQPVAASCQPSGIDDLVVRPDTRLSDRSKTDTPSNDRWPPN
jgi:hypothetical protein